MPTVARSAVSRSAFTRALTGQFDGVFSLDTYFGVTVVLIVFVLLLPPYRPRRWLPSLLPG